jgi:hypothetical protein
MSKRVGFESRAHLFGLGGKKFERILAKGDDVTEPRELKAFGLGRERRVP